MMEIKIKKYFLFFLFMITTACVNNHDILSEEFPGINLPMDEMNTKINLFAPKEANTFKIIDNTAIVIENISNTSILFHNDYGSKIFLRQDDQWIQVVNDMGYPAGEKILLPKNQTPLGGMMAVFHAAISENKPVTVRIFVFGQLSGGKVSKEEMVGAWIDVNLIP